MALFEVVVAATLASASVGGAPVAVDSAATGCRSGTSTKVIEHGPRKQKVVALTFDDGPSRYTKRILAILEDGGVTATFFPIGTAIDGREALLKKEFNAGHEIGNHTVTHADLGNGGQPATDEMAGQNEILERVLGYTPCLFRPPYDSIGNDLTQRARKLGMATISGEIDPRDWELPGSDAIVSTVLDSVKSGSIVILHDGGDGPRTQTIAALPRILKALKDRGYGTVTVSQLMGYKPRD